MGGQLSCLFRVIILEQYSVEINGDLMAEGPFNYKCSD